MHMTQFNAHINMLTQFNAHQVLGARAFDQGGLKELLESRRVRKIIYDGRADADALFHLFGVRLSNVYDVQVLQCITTPSRPAEFI